MLPLNSELDIQINQTIGGRRTLSLDIGAGVVRAVEIPGPAMSPAEWELIQLARDAYARMWGGDSEVKSVDQDPFDGLDPNDPYQTYHYIGQVDIPGAASRIITMRKVNLKPGACAEVLPPDDATFWLAQNVLSGERIPLWELLMEAVECPSKIAAISRTGTYPYRQRGRTPIEQERNGIAFAAIQVLATQGHSDAYFICQLCPEFQNRVHSVEDSLGRRISLDFTRTEETFNLPPEWQVTLNNKNTAVQEVKTFYPGYWVDGKAAAWVLRQLIQNGTLTYQELSRALKDVPGKITAAPKETTLALDEMIDFLTKPINFKYLIPVIKRHKILRHQLIHEAAGRPYSATLIPRLWRQSALNLLNAARKKYTYSTPYAYQQRTPTYGVHMPT